MSVDSNHVIAIATLSDWLKILRQLFNQWETKSNPIAPCTRDFSRAFNKLQVIARNFDWLIALFAPVLIGRSNYVAIAFSTRIWKQIWHKSSLFLCFEQVSLLNSIHDNFEQWVFSLWLDETKSNVVTLWKIIVTEIVRFRRGKLKEKMRVPLLGSQTYHFPSSASDKNDSGNLGLPSAPY